MCRFTKLIRASLLAFLLVSTQQLGWARQPVVVRTTRVPDAGIQPQVAIGQDGRLHMVYFAGDASAGDIYYVWAQTAGQAYSEPIRVNSQAGSAIAAGTIRGAQLALGRNDRVHVAWNGSGRAEPKGLPNPELPENSPYRLSAPMLYTRMNDAGTAFEPQRNLMTATYALDGGGSVAADADGRVYVAWHASSSEGAAGEAGRAVWLAISRDDGKSFVAESRVNTEPTGACGCCGLRVATDRQGRVAILYRAATDTIHRDMHLLVSQNNGDSFESKKLDEWEIAQCMMSSAALHATSTGMLVGWEADHQVKFARLGALDSLDFVEIIDPPPAEHSRKHPVLGSNSRGNTIFVWTEGTGWQQGGSVAWQIYDPSGYPLAGGHGHAEGLPVWGFAAVFPGPDDGFTIVY